ncbi:hypothetical protein AK812_SmicGene21801 [Symbiodinium microadriaticum]|uniref:Uncharacterized protein n=1 Tax=Symbiodinium microadriaticum TaxID=2951 RepID=A0A1Q9DLD3_SYMMI|nr:hypothetical protein AK812_SmicGene21801 [Symbiodinium microadriaticum]CAE7884248.1 unnamed protein product [Symbiodinium sp. KB8]
MGVFACGWRPNRLQALRLCLYWKCPAIDKGRRRDPRFMGSGINAPGEELTTSRVQLRLQQVAVGRLGAEPGLTRQNGSASAAPDEEKLEPNKDATKEIVQPESHVIGDDEEATTLRAMMLLQHEEEAIELARSIAKSAALPSPLAMDQTKVKDLDRIFDCIGRLQASADLVGSSRGSDILFLALEKIMSHFCVSLAELACG